MEEDFNKRFFVAIDKLVEEGQINSLSGFILSIGRHPSRYRNMRQECLYGDKSKHQYSRIEFCVIYELARQYHVSLNWLYFGIGRMFSSITTK